MTLRISLLAIMLLLSPTARAQALQPEVLFNFPRGASEPYRGLVANYWITSSSARLSIHRFDPLVIMPCDE